MAVKIIGTHDETFQADEVMACALLKLHPIYKCATIRRTREKEELDKCDIVVDVGEKFSQEDRRYDHHQRDFSLTMEELSKGEVESKTKLSSVGLIYFFYGKDVLRECLKCDDKVKIDWIWKKLYFNLIREIDHIDNHGAIKGKIKTGITARIGRENPDWADVCVIIYCTFSFYTTIQYELSFPVLKYKTHQISGKM